jgi:hypothetical protein
VGAIQIDDLHKEFNWKSIIWGIVFWIKFSMISSGGFWCSCGFNLNIAQGNHKETI